MRDTDTRIEQLTLSELLDDPLTGLLMHSDGIDRTSLERLIEAVDRRRLPAMPCRAESGAR